jgi:hypothetical protein
MKNTLWSNSPLFSVTFILIHSGSLWLHLPPAQNDSPGAAKSGEFLSGTRLRL